MRGRRRGHTKPTPKTKPTVGVGPSPLLDGVIDETTFAAWAAFFLKRPMTIVGGARAEAEAARAATAGLRGANALPPAAHARARVTRRSMVMATVWESRVGGDSWFRRCMAGPGTVRRPWKVGLVKRVAGARCTTGDPRGLTRKPSFLLKIVLARPRPTLAWQSSRAVQMARGHAWSIRHPVSSPELISATLAAPKLQTTATRGAT